MIFLKHCDFFLRRRVFSILFIVLSLNNASIFADEADTFIFYHIPKTGGTTITSLLNQQFPPELICPDDFYYQIEARNVDDLKRFRLFRGHFFYRSNLLVLGQSTKIVFLRDPILRVLSEARFYKGGESLGSDAQAHLRIGHFLPEGDPLESISNQQCLFLSSLDRHDPSITSEMHFASAKENLQNDFFFVGITEHMQESLEALYIAMDWQIPDQIPRLNHTDAIVLDDVDDVLLEGIKERNKYDIELYEFAKQLCVSRSILPEEQ